MPEKTFRAILRVLRVGLREESHLGPDNVFVLFQRVSVLEPRSFTFYLCGSLYTTITYYSKFTSGVYLMTRAAGRPRGYGCVSNLD